MKVGDYKIIVAKDGMLTYRYRWSKDIECSFNMLCEVAESYKPLFKQLTDGMRIETVKLDRRPWMADFVIDTKEEKK